MNHLKTHQTSLMAPWDPLNAPLDPLGPTGPPHRPPMTPKQVSCSHWTLQITSPASQITFTFNSVTDVAPSPLSQPSLPSPWDLETLIPWYLAPKSRVDLADLSSPVWSCLKMAKNLKGMKRNWENTCFQIVFWGAGGSTLLKSSNNISKVDSQMHYLH